MQPQTQEVQVTHLQAQKEVLNLVTSDKDEVKEDCVLDVKNVLVS